MIQSVEGKITRAINRNFQSELETSRVKYQARVMLSNNSVPFSILLSNIETRTSTYEQ